MSLYYQDDSVTLHAGDCIEVMRSLPDASVDAVVTDPPYGLEFMGKEWDAPWKDSRAKFRDSSEVDDDSAHKMSQARGTFPEAYIAGPSFQSWCTEWATEALRVLKPGGHLLAFGGTRTWHRLACAIEDAGFEVRDSIAWMYGSGFPKSLDVSKAMDKAAAEAGFHELAGDTPATDLARQWQGWGTALKPAFEPIVVARKPLIGTVAENVTRYGTGALNVDGGRVGIDPSEVETQQRSWEAWAKSRREGKTGNPGQGDSLAASVTGDSRTGYELVTVPAGRWPANVILDESQAEALDRQSGTVPSSGVYVGDGVPRGDGGSGVDFGGTSRPGSMYADTGGASRFFYTAKADANERPRVDGTAHPTVKPLDLMRYLVRLVTPPGGVVLEPFAGSGTTAEACIVEGFRCIAIEREADYLPLILQRITKPIEVTMW